MKTVKQAQVKSETELAVEAFLAECGIASNVFLVRANNVRDKWQCDSWLISLTKGNVSREFEYHTGTGHRVISNADSERILREYGGELYKDVTDGKIKRKGQTDFQRRCMNREYQLRAKPFAPHVTGLLYSLILDSSACDQSFDSWCEDYGYDNDSIKARNTYDACQKNTDNMRAIFSRDQIEKLSELLQDY